MESCGRIAEKTPAELVSRAGTETLLAFCDRCRKSKREGDSADETLSKPYANTSDVKTEK